MPEEHPYDINERFAAKVAIAMKYKSCARRVQELEWWIDILSAYKSPSSSFIDEIALLRKQIEEWKGQK